jgi:agmatinase
MSTYDPNDVGIKGNLFGFPYTEKEADLIILPVPWEVTVSFGSGTAKAPMEILEASTQLDFAIYGVKTPWKFKTHMLPVSSQILEDSQILRKKAENIIEQLENGEEVIETEDYREINHGCTNMVQLVYQMAKTYLHDGKLLGVLGGDHSTPLGLIKALGESEAFGILQIDAHMDLRVAYEGFKYSHASIMHHALQCKGVESLVQVGIRDFAPSEKNYETDKTIHVFYDDQIKSGLFHGTNWSEWVTMILSVLPQKVYLSVDMDGFDPSLCPNTGTPVPGGFSFEQFSFLLEELVRSGKEIVGFDLVETGDQSWDAIVAARVLFRLCTFMGVSKGKLDFD